MLLETQSSINVAFRINGIPKTDGKVWGSLLCVRGIWDHMWTQYKQSELMSTSRFLCGAEQKFEEIFKVLTQMAIQLKLKYWRTIWKINVSKATYRVLKTAFPGLLQKSSISLGNRLQSHVRCSGIWVVFESPTASSGCQLLDRHQIEKLKVIDPHRYLTARSFTNWENPSSLKGPLCLRNSAQEMQICEKNPILTHTYQTRANRNSSRLNLFGTTQYATRPLPRTWWWEKGLEW